MGRFAWFLIGTVLGAGLMFGGLKYHIVRTDKGFEFIPKISASLSQTYVDVREFDGQKWSENKMLSAAVVQAGREELFVEGAGETLREKFSKLLDGLKD